MENWTTQQSVIVASVVIGSLFIFALLLFIAQNRRRLIGARINALNELTRYLYFDRLKISQYPNPTLNGDYYGYSIVVNCEQKDECWRWRIHGELRSNWKGRLLIHGDQRPANMKEIYGLHTVITKDSNFDRAAIVACDDEKFAQEIFEEYLRQRYIHLQSTYFQFEWHEGILFGEMHTPETGVPGAVPALIDVMILTSAMIDFAANKNSTSH